MPASVGSVVVKVVGDIPSQHGVTEAVATAKRREELFPTDELAAEDPVDIEESNLHMRGRALGNKGVGVLRRRQVQLLTCHAFISCFVWGYDVWASSKAAAIRSAQPAISDLLRSKSFRTSIML